MAASGYSSLWVRWRFFILHKHHKQQWWEIVWRFWFLQVEEALLWRINYTKGEDSANFHGCPKVSLNNIGSSP
jgi:hypothetical protein